jgi:putative ABC transport system ATP-binding protein
MAHALLEARDLSRRHPEGNGWLLNGASIELFAGDRLAVWGGSGSGKTLLLRALALLDPLDRGEVLWRGEPVRGDHAPSFRRQVIYLHQRPVLSEQTVEASLRQPYGLRALRDRSFDRDRAVALLARLGRDARFLEKPLTELSGGEAQLVSLVRALQLDPAVLLMDEPTAALDPKTAQAFEDLVLDWVEKPADARAIAWVSHDAEQGRRVSNRSATIRSGTLYEN